MRFDRDTNTIVVSDVGLYRCLLLLGSQAKNKASRFFCEGLTTTAQVKHESSDITSLWGSSFPSFKPPLKIFPDFTPPLKKQIQLKQLDIPLVIQTHLKKLEKQFDNRTNLTVWVADFLVLIRDYLFILENGNYRPSEKLGSFLKENYTDVDTFEKILTGKYTIADSSLPPIKSCHVNLNLFYETLLHAYGNFATSLIGSESLEAQTLLGCSRITCLYSFSQPMLKLANNQTLNSFQARRKNPACEIIKKYTTTITELQKKFEKSNADLYLFYATNISPETKMLLEDRGTYYLYNNPAYPTVEIQKGENSAKYVQLVQVKSSLLHFLVEGKIQKETIFQLKKLNQPDVITAIQNILTQEYSQRIKIYQEFHRIDALFNKDPKEEKDGEYIQDFLNEQRKSGSIKNRVGNQI